MITSTRIPRSIRRLFYQRTSPEWEGVLAADAGITGPAAAVIIDDEWQLAKLQAAQDPYELMSAAMGYMMKVAKNVRFAASERGDTQMTRYVEEACQELANNVILATNEVRHLARTRGYDPAY